MLWNARNQCKGLNLLLHIIQSILLLCQTQPFSYRGSLKAGPRPFIRTRWNGQPMSETSWDRHRGKFLNKRLREILRERERDKCSKSSIPVTILWSIWDELGVRPEMRHRWWAFTTVVISAAVKSNMRSSYTLGENGRETAEFGAGSDPPKTQLGGNLFSAKIFLTPFLFLWNWGL